MATVQTRLTLDQIRLGALALPNDQRHELAEELYISLEQSGAFEMSPELTAEISRRSEELWSGKVQGIPHEQVMQELNALVDGE